MAAKRVVIVGGVAGGATCAARLRRLDESAEIVVLDRGPYVSFANCGLPYYVGRVIVEEKKLLLASPELFRARFNIEVRVENEVTAIDRERKVLLVREVSSGRNYEQPYDVLVLSPGAAPLRPAWPGIDLPGIFSLRTVPDSRRMRQWLDERAPKTAVVVGGGFIGLEMAENLAGRGVEVTLVERLAQVMPPLDAEMAVYAAERLTDRGVRLALEQTVREFAAVDGGLEVRTESGTAFSAEMVVVAIGVRPETELARAAGLELGSRGGIRVNERMQTSDASIYAVGDAVEVRHRVTGQYELIPLAGPANRQGRLAADAISGRAVAFNGVLGTAVCGFFDLTVAMTGATEKMLRRAGIEDFQSVYLHPAHHVGYYPGAESMHIKLLFRPSDGTVLGAQAVGGAGVERRMDVIATVMMQEGTVYDLEELELCYAPQFGAAKDAVNMAGMIAANVARGDAALAPWAEVLATEAQIVDVREPGEFAAGQIPGAINIPLGVLRERMGELDREREVWINCGVGQRAYYACRILEQHGYRARNLSGGFQTWKVLS